MKKKGFTLIEMIAVIAILALLIAIVLPNIINANDAKKQAQYEKILKVIENAAKVYHTELNKNARLVLVSDLIKNKYMENTKNPLTGEYFTGCVYINKVDGVYDYTYADDDCATDYTIVYNKNATGVSGSMPSKTCTMDETCTLDTVAFTKTGYIFNGWSKTADGAVDYADGVTVTDLPIGMETILYANWTAIPYTLTINYDGGIGTNSSGTHYTGDVITLDNPTKSNHIFIGWTITSGSALLSINDITITTSDVTIKANWQSLNDISFTYTGDFKVGDTTLSNTSYSISGDEWSIQFLTSGTLTLSKHPDSIDAFLLGGGGGGGSGTGNYSGCRGGGGGGGGFGVAQNGIELTETSYEIVIGAGGAATKKGDSTTAFGYTAEGGNAGGNASSSAHGTGGTGGGTGGTGGAGTGGTGIYAFLEEGNDIYAGGGGGGRSCSDSCWTDNLYGTGATYCSCASCSSGGAGGTGGGATGGESAAANTGGGGGAGGGGTTGGSGGSGIVIIRSRGVPLNVNLNGGTSTQSFKSSYTRGIELELTTPTKAGSVFRGWTVVGIDARLDGNTLTMGTSETTLIANWDAAFALAYTGTFTVNDTTYTNESVTIVDDIWNVEFLTSGFVTITNADGGFDAFLVGGGGGGGSGTGNYYGCRGGAGGNGGATVTQNALDLTPGTYQITIGSGGAAGVSGNSTSAFGYTASGGAAGASATSSAYASGGSGTGAGGGTDTDGSTGSLAFFETGNKIYAGGGGGGGKCTDSCSSDTTYGTSMFLCFCQSCTTGGTGGEGGGAEATANATANTGGGGGGYTAGSSATAGAGGSGIVIIRSRTVLFDVNLNGGTTTQSFKTSYARGSELSLTTPTKSGSTFRGWTVLGTDSSLNGNTLTMGTSKTTLIANWDATFAVSYTGKFKINETEYTNTSVALTTANWEVQFLTSGSASITSTNGNFDTFLVGGGGGGGAATGGYYGCRGGAGGNGGATTTKTDVSLTSGTYQIVIGDGGAIGSAGGTTSAFGYTASGGAAGASATSSANASGGTGTGAGGSTSASGSAGAFAFAESSNKVYAGGGGGGKLCTDSCSGDTTYGSDLYLCTCENCTSGGPGGNGGGAAGMTNAEANTGGGGGGAGGGSGSAGTGGSGIVILRNSR